MRKRTYAASEAAKRAICAALKNRMSQKSLNKITVSEIMRDCGMARQHFYYHFEDIYDAVRWMFDQEAVALLREHEGVMLWQDGLLQLFEYLQENRAVCLCALHSMSREHLKRFFQTDIHAIIQNTLLGIAAELQYPASAREVALLTEVYVGELAAGRNSRKSRGVDPLCGSAFEGPSPGRHFAAFRGGSRCRSAAAGGDLRLSGPSVCKPSGGSRAVPEIPFSHGRS